MCGAVCFAWLQVDQEYDVSGRAADVAQKAAEAAQTAAGAAQGVNNELESVSQLLWMLAMPMSHN